MAHQGWLTLYEVMDATGLPYGQVVALVEAGTITTAQVGSSTLYDPDTVDRFGGEEPPPTR